MPPAILVQDRALLLSPSETSKAVSSHGERDGEVDSDNSGSHAQEPADTVRTKILKCMLVREAIWCCLWSFGWKGYLGCRTTRGSIHLVLPQEYLTLHEPDRGHISWWHHGSTGPCWLCHPLEKLGYKNHYMESTWQSDTGQGRGQFSQMNLCFTSLILE